MAATGGDLIEISVQHDTLGTFSFFPKANEDNTFDPGGFRGTDDANMIDGAGRPIKQMNRVRSFFEVVVAKDDNTDNTMQQVADLAASPLDATYTLTHYNGSVWTMLGAPVGDVNGNMNNGTLSLKVAGAILKKTQG